MACRPLWIGRSKLQVGTFMYMLLFSTLESVVQIIEGISMKHCVLIAQQIRIHVRMCGSVPRN